MSCPFTGDDSNSLGLAEATIPGAASTSGNSDSATSDSESTTTPKAFRRGGKDDKITRADEGFFGPDSVAWKVWKFPGAALQGFARAVTIEHLDPDLVAAVDASGQVIKRTPIRYDRTMEYFAAVLAADAQTVIRMSDILMRVHDRSYGVNPVTGNHYEANKPSSQLWIHVTAWHSILYVYEKFGPGKLSRDEENEYWAQMKIAAQFQPIDLDDVPRTRGEVQAYLDSWREKLSASEAAVFNIDHILDGFETIEPDLPKWLQKLGRPLLRRSIIATYPRWMRSMMGLKESSKVMDTLSIAAWKPIYKILSASPTLFLWLVKRICPRALRYYVPILLKEPAETPRVYTPEVARRMFGNPLTPLEQREELLKKRQQGTGQKAYEHNHDDEILEFHAADDPETAEAALNSTKKYEQTQQVS
ncbi:oxygenase MpaB family protein [Corynebacterium sp.]|uniref:oxygenase MpaB family protein n=1 Tax=Corynebacterium sp. TaxID=1720 RepID=UPI0025BFF3CE|nr:oxygenase MpaB family protein [Corynebacterium sp.]